MRTHTGGLLTQHAGIPQRSAHLSGGADETTFWRTPQTLNKLPSTLEAPALNRNLIHHEQHNECVGQLDDGQLVDPWLFQAAEVVLPLPDYKTWTQFAGLAESNRPPLFMTESGPLVFDEWIRASQKPGQSVPEDPSPMDMILNNRSYILFLLTVAMGRSSTLYSWKDEDGRFRQTGSGMRISGYSTQALSGVCDLCLDCGTASAHIHSMVQKIYSRDSSTYQVATARAADDTLRTVHEVIGGHGRHSMTILQLEALILPCQTVLKFVESLMRRLMHTKHDGSLLAALYQEAEAAFYRHDTIRHVACSFLQRVSQPFLDFIGQSIGLRPFSDGSALQTGPGKHFMAIGTDVKSGGLSKSVPCLDQNKFPTFLPSDVSDGIIEANRHLTFLHQNHPGHIIVSHQTTASCQPPELTWQFDWPDAQDLETRVSEYAHAVEEMVGGGHQRGTGMSSRASEDWRASGELDVFGKSAQQVEERLTSWARHLDAPLPKRSRADDLGAKLEQRLLIEVEGQSQSQIATFTPDWSLVPMLSFAPVVSAQNRVLKRECLRLLFAAHGLREHLQVQRAFQLFGDGPFCARLSEALFDPGMTPAARQAGAALTGGSMGLRLGSTRDTWPPASSELRFALMGVLTDSYRHWKQSHGSGYRSTRLQGATVQTPGELSFAVRDLAPDEVEKCMDPDALEALDFLRISYTTPRQLGAVITPACLDAYDRIFGFLLRLLRMLHVVKHLHQELIETATAATVFDRLALRFQVEAHHFVRQTTAYFMTTGVLEIWTNFETWLDGVEGGLARNGGDRTEDIYGPDQLGQRHESALGEMTLALFLHKSQRQVFELLQEVYSVILAFAKIVARRESANSGVSEIRKLFSLFRKKVQQFFTACRDLGEKGSYSTNLASRGSEGNKRTAYSEENKIVQLVAMLDLSGYYRDGRP
jgi:hypothetical protein